MRIGKVAEIGSNLTMRKKMMLCSVCEEYCSTSTANTCSTLKGNNTFVTGCSNLKISAVVDHETSKGHQKAMSLHNAKNSSQDEISKSAAGHALNLLKSSERSRLSHLFRNAHAVAKNNRPLSDYVWLCATDKAKGLDIRDTYLNEKAAVCFLSYISGTVQEKTTSILNSAPFFSVIMDGSTDRTGDDQESVYIRTSHKGVIHERFFEIGCPQSTSAQDLFVFITNILNKHEVDTGRLVGFGSDGASNMVGIKSGLATLLKREINEEIINVHCLCHRLELSFRDVAKQQKLYDNLMTLLIGLNYFYTKSHKNKKGLLSAMEAINIKGTLPPKVTGTRWLPHLERAIVSLFKTFRAYEMHLSTSSHSNPKAEGLLKLLLSRNLMTFTVFLKDTVGPLMKLSQKLQKDGITLADSLLWIQTTIDVIDLSFTRNSDQLTDILETGKLQGVKLSGPCPEMAYRESMVKGFSDAMRCRFQLNPKDKTIVASTQILNLKNWPEDKSDLQGYSNVGQLV